MKGLKKLTSKKIIEHDNYFCLEVVNHYQVCKLRILLGVQVKNAHVMLEKWA